MNWQSSAIPPTIRRPWQVFQEDLEDKVLDCESQGVEVNELTRARVVRTQSRGAFVTFLDLTPDVQNTYVEVSLIELSAYVNWRSKQSSGASGTTEFEAGWDLLDMDAKADWIVDDPSSFLELADAAWKPLLTNEASPAEAVVAAMGNAPPVPQPKVEGEPKVKHEARTEDEHPQKAADAEAMPPPQKPREKAAKEPQAASLPTPIADTAEAAVPPKQGRLRRAGSTSAEAAAAPASSRARRSHPRAAVAKNSQKDDEDSSSSLDDGKDDDDENDDENDDEDEGSQESEAKPASKAVPRRSAREPDRTNKTSGKQNARKRKAAMATVCPEIVDVVCCVCKKGDHSADNDLGVCDRCDRGFHALCHDPIVANWGHPEDQWFCIDCVRDIAKERNLKFQLADFVWASTHAGALVWPARVTQIDFVSLADTKPYWVQFFDSGTPQGAWLSESQLVAWSDGPTFASIRESRRRLSVRMAEGDGAAPISSNLAQAPVKPLPRPKIVGASVAATASSAGLEGTPAKRNRRLCEKSPRSELKADPPDPAGTELEESVMEMKKMVREAKERQERLEKQVDEAMSQSQNLS